jgi:quinol monooxygenase YgiN
MAVGYPPRSSRNPGSVAGVAFVLTVRIVAREGAEERVAEILRELGEASRAEPACQAYVPSRDPADPRRFFVYEQYDDEDGLTAHHATEHFQRLAAGELSALTDRDRSVYETL